MKRSTSWIVLLCLIVSLSAGCFSQKGLTDFIEDQPGILTEHEKNRIADLYRALLDELDIHIKVTVLRESPTDINVEAVRLFDSYALGEKTWGAKGVLLLVDPQGKQVRIEIGYDLEAVFTDGFLGYIERKQMVPFFQARQVGPGIEATVELIVGKALGAIDESRYTVKDELQHTGIHYSGGGGARTDVDIGSGNPAKETVSQTQEYSPQTTPVETLKKYMGILKQHIKDPNLELYTPESRVFLSTWIVTDAQQDKELRDLEQASDSGHVLMNGDLAVIRFPIANRHVPPYFFRYDEDGWMLDFASMSKIIRFNHKNQWFFQTGNHPFMFAFNDITFDKNGFPHEKHGDR
jgi:uncharacterized protein